MTKDDARVEMVMALDRLGLSVGEIGRRLREHIENYASACVAEALQPKRTGRLPWVGVAVEVMRSTRTGKFSPRVVAESFPKVDGDERDACFLLYGGGLYDLEAEGITWRWPDEEKGA